MHEAQLYGTRVAQSRNLSSKGLKDSVQNKDEENNSDYVHNIYMERS